MNTSKLSQPKNLIELSRVNHFYGVMDKPVLKDIELQIPRGRFITLLGPSGCGKSSLLRILAKLQTPDHGAINWHFKETETKESSMPVSFVFQEPRLLPWRNVKENIRLPFEINGSQNELDLRIDNAIQSVGLKGEENKRPSELSGGMRMRVSLARAIVTSPQLLLLDEPFGALDELLRQQLNQEMLRLWKEHQWTVVFVTHNIAEAVFLSEEIHVMQSKPGRIIKSLEVPFDTQSRLNTKTDIRHSDPFLKLVQEITSSLKGEASP